MAHLAAFFELRQHNDNGTIVLPNHAVKLWKRIGQRRLTGNEPLAAKLIVEMIEFVCRPFQRETTRPTFT